ncbi:MAG: hypothetical protein LWW88_13220, partial [Acinetobacter sp.]
FLSMNMISNYLTEKFYFSNQANVVKYYVNYFKLNENIYISDQLQLKLSHNENADVRCLLALNPFVGEQTQSILAQDQSIVVKSFLYLNPYISEKTKLKVVEDYKKWSEDPWIIVDSNPLFNIRNLIWP